MTLSEELRTKKSRDNRDLLDRAADRIDELERCVAELSNIITKFCQDSVKTFSTLSEIKALVMGERTQNENN